MPFGDEIVAEPDRDDVESAMGDVDLVADIQLRFVKFSVRQIYMACSWNDKARNLDAATKDFDTNLFEIREGIMRGTDAGNSHSSIRRTTGVVENKDRIGS